MRVCVMNVTTAWMLCGAMIGCGSPELPRGAASAVVGTTVNISLPSHEGALVALPHRAAKATLVDGFAPTCEPCKKKVPALLARKKELASKGVSLVLVAVLAEGESTSDAEAALQSWGVSSGFLVDRGDVLSRELGIRGLPASVVIDAAGTVRWVAQPTAEASEVAAAAEAIAAR